MTQADASPSDVVLRLAASAYLGRYTGVSRLHSESDLRLFFTWCAERDLPPLEAQQAQIELYVRWIQEVRRFKPFTVSRRMAVVTGFYRTCVIDTVLEHSPADYVRRPRVPNESPVLGLSHLQFEALLAAARESNNQFDFASVAMLGLLGLRISEATNADADDLGEEHGHRVLLVHGKGCKEALVRLPPLPAEDGADLDVTPQHQQLDVLVRRKPAEQNQPATEPNKNELQQSQRYAHDHADRTTVPDHRSSTHVCRVLAPHRVFCSNGREYYGVIRWAGDRRGSCANCPNGTSTVTDGVDTSYLT